MAGERLFYLPLGGAGEIGMNAYVYGFGAEGSERLILVDAGVTFPDMESTPGVDLILPDFSWLFERSRQVDGIFLTHAHEDHLGAVGVICRSIEAPVYARPFTMEIAAKKLEEFGVSKKILREVATHPAESKAGPFTVSFLHAAHSVPEASALLLETPGGRILHTGDFKFDESPTMGDPLTADSWKRAIGTGVTALVCDSTNALQRRKGRSEASVGPGIQRLVEQAKGMVVATTFASNIARVSQIAQAGRLAEREIVLLGRAMHRMLNAALQTGVVSDFPRTIEPNLAAGLPRNKLLVIATGSQGEPRSATAQLAAGKFQGIEVERGDTLLYSSKTIPGNERAVSRIINMMAKKGVDVVDDSAEIYHVSGHPNGPDLENLHIALRPKSVIPMHGEYRHLLSHSNLAKKLGMQSLVAENGTVVEFGSCGPRISEKIEAGRTYLDGFELIGARDGVIRERRQIARNGFVGVVLRRSGRRRAEVRATVWSAGLPAQDIADFEERLEEVAAARVADKLSNSKSEDEMKSIVARAVRHEVFDHVGKKPVVAVKFA
ncbi:MAG: ribonuclease J [Albidovulum sp.]|nr:ribonuclease J [Albidovulum sp.]MDE0531345.1 ribonuclease J [Albidovulum sp.]